MISAAWLQRPGVIRGGISAAALLLIAGTLGWRGGETPPPSPVASAERPWSLPPHKTNDPTKDLAMLAGRKPWGTSLTPMQIARAKRVQAVPRWRLAGIVQRGGETLVLIADAGPKPKFEYRRVGEPLPDGSTLVEITADGAVTKGGGSSADEKRVYQLFDHKQK